MLGPKQTYTFNFTIEDKQEGTVQYSMMHSGETKVIALKNLRANLASIIQDINIELSSAAKPEETK